MSVKLTCFSPVYRTASCYNWFSSVIIGLFLRTFFPFSFHCAWYRSYSVLCTLSPVVGSSWFSSLIYEVGVWLNCDIIVAAVSVGCLWPDYPFVLCNIPEDWRPQLHHGGDIKPFSSGDSCSETSCLLCLICESAIEICPLK